MRKLSASAWIRPVSVTDAAVEIRSGDPCGVRPGGARTPQQQRAEQESRCREAQGCGGKTAPAFSALPPSMAVARAAAGQESKCRGAQGCASVAGGGAPGATGRQG